MNKVVLPYVVVKGLSVFVLYFLLLKYNLTSETYSESMRRNFPGAPEMDIVSMVAAALYLTWLPLLLDAALLTAFSRLVKPTFPNRFWSFGAGVVLHLPIGVLWLVADAVHWLRPNVAARWSLALSFLVAGLAMAVVVEARRRAAE